MPLSEAIKQARIEAKARKIIDDENYIGAQILEKRITLIRNAAYKNAKEGKLNGFYKKREAAEVIWRVIQRLMDNSKCYAHEMPKWVLPDNIPEFPQNIRAGRWEAWITKNFD